jgi:hypothetical protein
MKWLIIVVCWFICRLLFDRNVNGVGGNFKVKVFYLRCQLQLAFSFVKEFLLQFFTSIHCFNSLLQFKSSTHCHFQFSFFITIHSDRSRTKSTAATCSKLGSSKKQQMKAKVKFSMLKLLIISKTFIVLLSQRL